MTAVRHVVEVGQFDRLGIERLFTAADRMRELPRAATPLAGFTLATIFYEPSTRTRLSFEVAVVELGGHPIMLRGDELQLSRGESLRDFALVLSRQVHAVGLRTGPHQRVEELASSSAVPVINLLTSEHHPCQALADLLTLREAFGGLEGLRLAYVGDGNNVARSLARLAPAAGVEVVVAAPDGHQLEPGSGARLVSDPAEAVDGANAVYTDVWVSMGDEDGAQERRRALAPDRVDDALLDRAAPGAVALHCLPAHHGEEITAEVLYGSRQRVWDQAENRRHVQKALLELLVDPRPEHLGVDE